MRRTQNADTHVLKQHWLSQNISPVCSSFVLVIASDVHLESESKKQAENVNFHTAKNIQIQPRLLTCLLWSEHRRAKTLGSVLYLARLKLALRLMGDKICMRVVLA